MSGRRLTLYGAYAKKHADCLYVTVSYDSVNNVVGLYMTKERIGFRLYTRLNDAFQVQSVSFEKIPSGQYIFKERLDDGTDVFELSI